MPDTKHSEEQAKAQLESIREMIAALECDYDRLQELRDERDNFEMDDDANASADGPGYKNNLEAWAGENPDEAEELAELESAATINGDTMADADEARERIEQDPLSVQVRSSWHSPGEDADDADGEFEILLCTGGPAVRIRGELADHEPHRAWLEHQDWGTPWTHYYESGADEVLLAYARCLLFAH